MFRSRVPGSLRYPLILEAGPVIHNDRFLTPPSGWAESGANADHFSGGHRISDPPGEPNS
jgi:hypothetical protein